MRIKNSPFNLRMNRKSDRVLMLLFLTATLLITQGCGYMANVHNQTKIRERIDNERALWLGKNGDLVFQVDLIRYRPIGSWYEFFSDDEVVYRKTMRFLYVEREEVAQKVKEAVNYKIEKRLREDVPPWAIFSGSHLYDSDGPFHLIPPREIDADATWDMFPFEKREPDSTRKTEPFEWFKPVPYEINGETYNIQFSLLSGSGPTVGRHYIKYSGMPVAAAMDVITFPVAAYFYTVVACCVLLGID